MSYYDNSQWSTAGPSSWEHQTPPPGRSGASSAVPREEPAAFAYQFEEVERATDILIKGRQLFAVQPNVPRFIRGSAGSGPRPHTTPDYVDARGPRTPSNLQNFFATQRHQSSRGSNEAEQMMQAKRRMAAQRERDLRNFHQEQQYNRSRPPSSV